MTEQRAASGHAKIDRVVDIFSVILITLTAVFSAVCVYQSARWGGEQTLRYNDASNQRIEAGVQSAKADEFQIIDVGLFLRYLDAVHDQDRVRQQFIYDRIRPEAKPAIVAWLKLDPLHNRKAPANPFVMPEYHLAAQAEQHRLEALSAQSFEQATMANKYSDEFLFLTVTFATVSFLGGISTKFKFPYHLIVVVLGCGALVYGLLHMSELSFR